MVGTILLSPQQQGHKFICTLDVSPAFRQPRQWCLFPLTHKVLAHVRMSSAVISLLRTRYWIMRRVMRESATQASKMSKSRPSLILGVEDNCAGNLTHVVDRESELVHVGPDLQLH